MSSIDLDQQFRKPRSARIRVATWLPPILIVALAAVLRLYHLGTENLWIDEVFSMDMVRSPIHSLERFWNPDGGINSRPFGLVLVFLARQFGDSEFIVRLPFALLGILDVGVLYLLAREIVDRHVALRASLFLALLPVHVWYSQEARWYAQWTFLTTVSLWMLVRFWKTDRARWWVGYLVTMTLNLYTFVASLLVAAVQFLTALLLPARKPSSGFRWKVVAALFVAGVLTMPIFLAAFGIELEPTPAGVPNRASRAMSPFALPYLFFAYVAGFSIGPTVGELHALPGPLVILRKYPEVVVYYAVFSIIATLGLWALRGRRLCAAVVLPWVLVLPLLALAGAVFSHQTINVRYTMAATPGFALLLSLGVESFGRWHRWVTLVVVGLFAASLANYYWNPDYDKDDVRGAVEYVQTSRRGNEPVVVVGQIAPAAEYYGRGLHIETVRGCLPRWMEVGSTPRAPVVQIDSLVPETSFWFLTGRDWIGRSEECMEKLGATHETVKRASYTGVDVYRMHRR